jgi:hypothetical protein
MMSLAPPRTLLLWIAGLAALATTAAANPRQVQAVPAVLDAAANGAARARLGLESFAAQRLALPATASREATDAPRLTLLVTFPDAEVALVLEPRNLRSAGFALHARTVAGLVPLAVPAPIPSYRGEAFVAGEPSPWRVAATLEGGRLRAVLRAPDGRVRGIQPLADAVPGADPTLHVAYLDSAIVAGAGRCAIDPPAPTSASGAAGDGAGQGSGPDPKSAPPAASAKLRKAEIAFEADTSYYASRGSSVPAVTGDVETLLAALADIYEAEVGITYEMSSLVIQTDGSEQYGSTDSETLLVQFRNFWNQNHDAIARDTVHLLTGRNLNGSTIGIAYVGVICFQSYAYGLSETTYTGNLVQRVGLLAHEVGHNWNAGHCDNKNDCSIMCSGLGGCAGNVQAFGKSEENQIESFRDQLSCLQTTSTPVEPPFHDGFEQDQLASSRWKKNKGAVVTKTAVGETSGLRSVVLEGAGSGAVDQLISKPIDFTSMPAAELAFFAEHRGVEAGEELVIEYLDAAASWIELARIASDGSKQNAYRPYAFVLPPAARIENGAIRFRPETDQGNDDWFLDDVEIREPVITTGPTFCTSGIVPIVVPHVTGNVAPTPKSTTVGNCGSSGSILAYQASEPVNATWLTLGNTSGLLGQSATTDVGVTVAVAGAATGIETSRLRIARSDGAPTDHYDLGVTRVVAPTTLFEPGDALDGEVAIAGDVDTAHFVAVAGLGLDLVLTPTAGLKLTVRCVELPAGTIAAEFAFKGKPAAQKTRLTLPNTALYRLELEGRDGTTGAYQLATGRTLPKPAALATTNLAPAIAGGTVESSFLALPGARLELTVAATAEGNGPYTLVLDAPDGQTLNPKAFTTALPDGGMLILDMPLLGPGEYFVTVSGFVATENVRVTSSVVQPALGTATRTID